MSNTLLTVLMPVYNGELFLQKTIDSILCQTYKDFEFLIINDGSEDRSEDIIKSYKDSRIKYVKNDENLKLIKTLNKGIDLAQGKYIVRIDADDIALKDRLENQFEFMESNPEIIGSGTFYSVINERNEVLDLKELPTNHQEILFSMLFLNPICHPSVIWRNDIVKKNKIYFNEDYVHAEDYKFWYDLSQFGQLANIPKKLLEYRIHANQVSQVFSKEQLFTDFKIKKEVLKGLFNLTFHENILKLLNQSDLNNSERNLLLKFFIKLVLSNKRNKKFDTAYLLTKIKPKIFNNTIELERITLYNFSLLVISGLFFSDLFNFKQRLSICKKLIS